MSVTLTGDWQQLKGILSNVARSIESKSGKQLGRDLAKIETTVLDHLDAQDLGWPGLDETYKKQKADKGLSPDTLRATNQMYENITTDQPTAFEGMVGVQRGVLSKDGEEVVDIAIIHEQPENDGKKIKARKLWQPTFEELQDELGEKFCNGIVSVFKK